MKPLKSPFYRDEWLSEDHRTRPLNDLAEATQNHGFFDADPVHSCRMFTRWQRGH